MSARRPRILSNKRRKGVLAVAVPWLRRFGLIAGGAFLILWAGAWLWVSGAVMRLYERAQSSFHESVAANGFILQDVQIEGLVFADRVRVENAIAAAPGMPLLDYDVQAARQRLESLPWIAQAHVERRMPATIYVRIKEHEPLARWRIDEKLTLLDTQGQPIIRLSKPDDFSEWPLVEGAGADQGAPVLLSLLRSFPDLLARFDHARFVEGRRWDLIFTSGLVVYLPEQDIPQALDRLARAQVQGGLLEQPYQSIDLRSSGRMVLKPVAQGPGV
ncbi:MAG: FtsQ-type POTRA domain-containing protein [Alphaproteobacteria bacterium]|nr:FtsQ-type POTRA domain-containing protein [Alphaproteobacteria bacterium]